MLEGDVVVVIIFSVVEPVVAKYYQLCRYEHDLGNNQDITSNYKTPAPAAWLPEDGLTLKN